MESYGKFDQQPGVELPHHLLKKGRHVSISTYKCKLYIYMHIKKKIPWNHIQIGAYIKIIHLHRNVPSFESVLTRDMPFPAPIIHTASKGVRNTPVLGINIYYFCQVLKCDHITGILIFVCIRFMLV